MRTGQTICFDPDRTDFSSLTAIQTLSFVQDSAAHCFFFYIVVVAADHFNLLVCQFFFRELSFILFDNSFECFGTLMLVSAGCCNGISLCVAFFVYIFTQFVVINFVAVFAFNQFAASFGQFKLCLALYFDRFMCDFDRFQHFRFLNFVHFAFHHHDVVKRSTHHNINICFFQFRERGVDYILAIDACDTAFGDWPVERNIRYGQCGGSRQSGQCVRHIFTVCGE
ncbi:unknown [Parabacteroides johnsonii CAG:246]|nr:unknown [Parabacteroides johnsonii CAG:246]